jgi:hypothetical protein
LRFSGVKMTRRGDWVRSIISRESRNFKSVLFGSSDTQL